MTYNQNTILLLPVPYWDQFNMLCLNNTHELFLKEESDIQTMEQNKYNLSTLTLLSDSISYAISVIRLGLKDMRKKRNTWNRSETF